MVARWGLIALFGAIQPGIVSVGLAQAQIFKPAGVEERCTFASQYGDVDCASFALIVTASASVILQGQGDTDVWTDTFTLDCTQDSIYWNTYDSQLPWTVDVQNGDTCTGQYFPHVSLFVNTWITYAGLNIDLSSSDLCSDQDNGSVRYCILPITPS